jgi:hypothetical protein
MNITLKWLDYEYMGYIRPYPKTYGGSYSTFACIDAICIVL